MAFINRIRLPFKLTRPQYQEEREDYRLANGVTKTLSVVISKVYEGITDYMPDKMHERLKIALAHDTVSIEGDKYVGGINQTSDYQIEWVDFLDYPFAQAKFKANITPYNASNNNCATCDTFAQVVCVDDNVGTLDEGQTYEIDVLANDSICCNPITISIVTFNDAYLAGLLILPDNKISITLETGLSDVNSVNLVTYRAECENGIYDEASIIANINGTDPTPACLAPTDVIFISATDTTADFSWTAPSPVPDCGYIWEVRTVPQNIFVSTGTTAIPSVTVTGLSASESYSFKVKSDCCDGEESGFTSPVLFDTNPPSGTETCGQYEIANDDFPGTFGYVQYIDCAGVSQEIYVPGLTSVIICALQNGPNDPVEIDVVGAGLSITYLGLC